MRPKAENNGAEKHKRDLSLRARQTRSRHITGTVMSERRSSKGSRDRTVDRRPNGPLQPRLLDYKTAAAYLSLSYWSIRELVLDGVIPHLKFGKKVLIDRRDLDDWIESRKEQGVF